MPLPTVERRPIAAGDTGLQQSAGIVDQAQTSLFGSLADAARGLRRRLQPALDNQARDMAAEDVVRAAEAREAGTTMVNVPERFTLTQQDEIYNQVVRSGVAAEALNDFATKARELEEKYQFDPEGFDAEATKFQDDYTGLQDADTFLVTEIDREARKLFGDTKARIDARTRQAQLTEKQQAMELRLSHISGQMATLIEEQGPGAVYESDYIKLQEDAINVVSDLVNNPAFGWSDERGAEALDGLANQQQELTEIKVMESIYRTPGKDGGTVKAMEYIDTAVNRMQLDQGERIGARSRMQQRLAWLQQKDALEEKAKEDNAKALKAAGEAAALQYEADLLSRMGRGDKPSTKDIDTMAGLVAAGWMEPSRMSTYVNAATSTAPTRSDEIVLASLFDYARQPGVTQEEIQRVTIQAMSDVTLTASDRERVLEAYNDAQDARAAPGLAMLEGSFASGFMDVDTASVKSAKARAESEFMAWLRQNPDATPFQAEQKAKSLAVEAGRRMPRPPMPSIPRFGNPPVVTLENVDKWAVDARIAAADALDTNSIDPGEFTRVMTMIDEQVAWQKEQARLMQETTVNADQ